MDSPAGLSPFEQMNRPTVRPLMLGKSQFDIRFQPIGMATNGRLSAFEVYVPVGLEGCPWGER